MIRYRISLLISLEERKLENLLRRISKEANITDISLIKPVGNLLIDSYYFPVMLDGANMIDGFLVKVHGILGDGEEAFLHHQGRCVGEDIYYYVLEHGDKE